jgi:hypothetical protein
MLPNRTNIAFSVTILLIFLFLVNKVVAQYSIRPSKPKESFRCYLTEDFPWNLEAQAWLPGFRGDFNHGDFGLKGGDGDDPGDPADINDDTQGSTLENVFSKSWQSKIFVTARFAYEKERTLLQLDGLAGSAGQSVKFNHSGQEIVEGKVSTYNVRFLAGTRFVSTKAWRIYFKYELFGYLGARYQNHRIMAESNENNILDITPHWVEPVIGLQNQFVLRRWYLILQGDYGGYFANNQHTFQFQAVLYHRISKLLGVKAGWMILDLDQQRIYDGEDIMIDMRLSGPSIGIAIFLL